MLASEAIREELEVVLLYPLSDVVLEPLSRRISTLLRLLVLPSVLLCIYCKGLQNPDGATV